MLRKLALSFAFAATSALLLSGCNQTTAGNGVVAPVPVVQAAPVQGAFVYGGQNYCWYPAGWKGAGFYWCGYPWRTGLGWGGIYGWNGWGGGYAAGWHGYGVWHAGAYRLAGWRLAWRRLRLAWRRLARRLSPRGMAWRLPRRLARRRPLSQVSARLRLSTRIKILIHRQWRRSSCRPRLQCLRPPRKLRRG